MSGISFIVPTIGRASLLRALASIAPLAPDDEILVIGATPYRDDARARYLDCPRGHDWGCTERTLGIANARGRYLAFLDDDDVYLPGTPAVMHRAIAEDPGRPILFRMTYPNGFVLWADPALRMGNVSTQMILIPNEPARLGRWSARREGDFDFLASMAWAPEAIIWRTEIVARLGHNDSVPAELVTDGA